jgi:hypothetical protein
MRWRDLTTDTIDLYWCGARQKKCVLRREQFVWRLIDGKAKYVHYRITKHQLCDDAKFVLLQNELVNHAENLFVFVLHPEVEATNNRSERQARAEAMARKAARTSKTESGARRRSVIMSVLASLSKRMEHFTLGSVLAEINRYTSCARQPRRQR